MDISRSKYIGENTDANQALPEAISNRLGHHILADDEIDYGIIETDEESDSWVTEGFFRSIRDTVREVMKAKLYAILNRNLTDEVADTLNRVIGPDTVEDYIETVVDDSLDALSADISAVTKEIVSNNREMLLSIVSGEIKDAMLRQGLRAQAKVVIGKMRNPQISNFTEEAAA